MVAAAGAPDPFSATMRAGFRSRFCSGPGLPGAPPQRNDAAQTSLPETARDPGAPASPSARSPAPPASRWRPCRHVGEPLRVPGCRSGDPPATACTRSPRSRGSSGRTTRKRWPAATAARDRWCRHRTPTSSSCLAAPASIAPSTAGLAPVSASEEIPQAPLRPWSNQLGTADGLTHALLSASARLGPLAFLETVAAPLPGARSVRPGRRARLRGPPRALPLRAAGRRPALAARWPRRSGPAGR